MSAISYVDAKVFREKAGAPLAWEEDVLPPPLDRVAFTRLILEAAETTGVGSLEWKSSIPFGDTEERWITFQSILHQYTSRQSFQGIPTTHWSGWIHGGHASVARALNWGEYIEHLEEDYCQPWMTAWKFGFCADREERILADLKQWLVTQRTGWTVGSDGYYDDTDAESPKYPEADKIDGSEVIARYVLIQDGVSFESETNSQFGVGLHLIDDRFLGIRGDIPFLFPMFLGIVGLCAVIFGAFQRYYSGWWLFLFVPLVITGYVFAQLKIGDFYVRDWIDRTMTFHDLARRISEIKEQEWKSLQGKYNVPSP